MTLPEGKLSGKVSEREELVRSIEFFIVLAVAALDLAIVSGYSGCHSESVCWETWQL